VASLELESPAVPISVQAGCRTIVSDRRIHSNALIVTEELPNKVVAWATEIASYAARLPSKQARDAYLRERGRELVTGAQAEGATVCDAAIVADDRGAPNYDRTVSATGGRTAGARLAYHRFGELIGFKGIYLDRPDAIGAACSKRPVVLEVKTDPEVPPLRPHMTRTGKAPCARALRRRPA
jgi:hypothetical protein